MLVYQRVGIIQCSTVAHLRSRKDVQQLHGRVNLEGDKALELLQQCCQVVYS